MDLSKQPLWNNYKEIVEHMDEDKAERPPLTGKNRYIPKGLYDEPWHCLWRY